MKLSELMQIVKENFEAGVDPELVLLGPENLIIQTATFGEHAGTHFLSLSVGGTRLV